MYFDIHFLYDICNRFALEFYPQHISSDGSGLSIALDMKIINRRMMFPTKGSLIVSECLSSTSDQQNTLRIHEPLLSANNKCDDNGNAEAMLECDELEDSWTMCYV